MRSVKAIYENGHLMFSEGTPPLGRMEVVVVFPETGETNPRRNTEAGKRFVQEWAGVLKGCDISRWTDDKAEFVKGTPHENPACLCS
jgi:hypothetical protein